jgi:3-phenylpropionate/trans-cinnamate dioxygenase ferredoxin reductase component
MNEAGVVIVGAGQAGGTVATGLAQAGYKGPITLIGDEAFAPYQRPPLSKGYVCGDMNPDSLLLKPAAYYEQKNIRLIMGNKVTAIHRGRHCVELGNGEQMPYGSLVLCTGAMPRNLLVNGARLNNVFSLRSIDDAERITRALDKKSRLVIIGAGYVGLELAATCSKLGKKVAVLERADRVMQRSASPEVSAHYETMHRAAGIEIVTDVAVSQLQGETAVQEVCSNDGRCWSADIVVIGVGAIPGDELARAAGLACDDGIMVDANCLSSDGSIYAAGDCARQTHEIIQQSLRLESVQNATAQARMIVAHIMGKPAPRVEVPWFWSDQFDVRLQIAGIIQPSYERLLRGDPDSGSFTVLHLQDDRLQALEAVNRPMDFTLGKRLIAEQQHVVREALMDADVLLYPQTAMTKQA